VISSLKEQEHEKEADLQTTERFEASPVMAFESTPVACSAL
jgi:hypothetical protein